MILAASTRSLRTGYRAMRKESFSGLSGGPDGRPTIAYIRSEPTDLCLGSLMSKCGPIKSLGLMLARNRLTCCWR